VKFYGLFSVVGRISGRCSGISAVEAPSLPHRDYKYTKFSKKTSIPALSPPKKHPSRPQRRLPTGRKLRSTPSPSSRDHPAAACGARPAPANETTRPQPAEHAAAQADERASITTGHSPLRIGTLRPLRPAAYRNPAPEITRPHPAEHPQPQLTNPPGRSLRSTPRRKPTSGPPPGEAAARATPKSRTPSIPRHRPTPGLRSYRSAAFPPDAGHPSPPDSSSLRAGPRDTPGHPAKRPAHRIPLHVTPRHDEAGAAPQSDTGPYPFRKALPATAASGSPAAVRPAPSIPTPSGTLRHRPPPSATVRRPPPAPRR